MTISEKAAAWAENIARDDAHGYDQASRWGPDYDCSSLVIAAYKAAGLALMSTYTGNMRADFLAHGFADVTKTVDLAAGAGLRRGDVLLNERSHAAICTGGGQLINASGNERGGVSGGESGDQTGREIAVRAYYNFPWDCVLRYEGDTSLPEPNAKGENRPGSERGRGASPSSAQGQEGGVAFPASGLRLPSPEGEGIYTVRSGDSLWSIAERELGDGARYEELRRENALSGYTIYPGQTLRLPLNGRTTVSLTLRAEAWENMERRAADRGKTVAALLEELFATAS